MARITQEVRPTNDPSYIGLSREPDRIRPNQSLGTLFEGIGQAADGVVTAVDNYNQSSIDNEIRKGNEKLTSEQGVQAALDTDGGLFGKTGGQRETVTGAERFPLTRLNVPPNAPEVEKQMQRLAEARAQGQIGDTSYYTKLEALSRQLKARYPGYRDVIDQKFQSITGVVPANALRREIDQQLEKQAHSAATRANSFETFAKQKAEYLPPDFWNKYGTANAYSETYIYQYVQRQERDKLEHDIRMGDLAEAKANNENTSERARQVATGMVTNTVTKVLSDANTSITGGKGSITQMVIDMAGKGTAVSPKDTESMIVALNQLETQTALGLRQRLFTPDRNGISLAQHINDPKKVQDIIDQGMEQITTLKKAISTGDFSTAAANLRLSTAMQQETGRQILGSDAIRRLSVIKDKIGDVGMSIILADEKQRKTLMGAILTDNVSRIVTDPEAKFTEGFDRIKKDPSASGADYKKYMDDWRRLVTSGQVPPDGVKALMQAVFKENEGLNILDKFTEKDRVNVYLQMGGPQVAAAVKQLNDPEVTANYLKWMDSGLNTVFGTHLRGMAKESNTNGLWTTAWDPAVGRFVPQIVPGSEKKLEQLGLYLPGSVPNFKNIMGPEFDNLEQINKGLQSWAPAMKALGKDPTQSLQQFMDQYQFKIDGSRPTQKGFFQKLWDGIGGSSSAQSEKDAQQLGAERFKKQQPQTPQRQSSLIDLSAPPPVRLVSAGDSDHMIDAVNRGQDPVTVAMRYIDVDETDGRGALKAMFAQSLGKDVDPALTPWCAAFANAVIQSTGGKGTGSLGARSFLDWGTPTDNPKKGDIVVFSRGSDPNKGHVGFFVGMDENGNYLVLGGNQGNKVGVGTYPASRFLGARKPPKAEQMAEIVQQMDTQTA